MIGVHVEDLQQLPDEIVDTTPQQPPVAPSNLIAGQGSTGVLVLQWAAISGADEYKIYRDGTHVATTAASGGTSWTETDALVVGQEYEYWITAVDLSLPVGIQESSKSNSSRPIYGNVAENIDITVTVGDEENGEVELTINIADAFSGVRAYVVGISKFQQVVGQAEKKDILVATNFVRGNNVASIPANGENAHVMVVGQSIDPLPPAWRGLSITQGQYDIVNDIPIPVSTASPSTDLVTSDMGATAISALSKDQFTALLSGGLSTPDRHYVGGESAASISQRDDGNYWLGILTTPSIEGSNHVDGFHNVGNIDPTKPIILEQSMEIGEDWTPGGRYIVQKAGFGLGARASDTNAYVVNGSRNPNGFSARNEIYGPNGPNSQFTENTANLGCYIYYVGWDPADYLSRHLQTNVVIKAGSLYKTRMVITPNTEGNSDGACEYTASEISKSTGAVIASDTVTKSNIMWMQGAFTCHGLSNDMFNGGDDSDYSSIGGPFSIYYRNIRLYQP